jgi:outer membrane protein insertion porin family
LRAGKSILVSVLFAFVSTLAVQAWAQAPAQGFEVENIRVEGLQRIGEATVLNYLPIEVGDRVDGPRLRDALRALYETGFFDDVAFERDDGTLVVRVRERPSIARLEVAGNRQIQTEDLMRAMRGAGIAEGRVLDRLMIDQMEQELYQVYYAQGRYGVNIESRIREVDQNQVTVTLQITEGRVAHVRRLNIVGNEVFGDSTLKGRMEARERGFRTVFSSRDQYSREKLQGDLETLRSYYMDRGYADFRVRSTQVSISPDRRDVFVTISIDEGEVYEVDDVRLVGDFVVPEEDLRRLVQVQPGTTFSMRQATNSAEFMKRRLAAAGYARAEVTPVPELDDETRRVSLTFYIEPDRRIYVRRVNITGTESTDDEVYRRELRQFERAPLSNTSVERSRVRMQRLPFVQNLDIEETSVPGSPDEVDLEVTVTEREFGQFQIGAGYGQISGLMLNTSIEHSNLFGRGHQGALSLERNTLGEFYSVSHTNPYASIDGVSRTFSMFYDSRDLFVRQASPVSITSYGGNIRWGLPISEFDRVRYGAGVRRSEFVPSLDTSPEMLNFIRNHGEPFQVGDFVGSRMYSAELNLGWTRDTRNRAIFADRGQRRTVSLDVALPDLDLEYYSLRLEQASYLPLGREWTLGFDAELGYADTYGDTEMVPPFRHFFAGGSRSVRGYRGGWLGPRDSFGRPFGGTVKANLQTDLYLPDFFSDEDRPGAPQYRFSVFLDAGYVWEDLDSVDRRDLRYSVGISASWMTPLGVLRFSIAEPLNATAEDRDGRTLDRFQFEVGTGF